MMVLLLSVLFCEEWLLLKLISFHSLNLTEQICSFVDSVLKDDDWGLIVKLLSQCRRAILAYMLYVSAWISNHITSKV